MDRLSRKKTGRIAGRVTIMTAASSGYCAAREPAVAVPGEVLALLVAGDGTAAVGHKETGDSPSLEDMKASENNHVKKVEKKTHKSRDALTALRDDASVT